ncbi:MAG: hypothetical protein KIS96_03500 [Bauldia sp.]|nr:hypothetical protein [Bauldia sp.]
MQNAGLFDLGSVTITGPVTDHVITSASWNGAAAAFIAGLAGMQSATLWAAFDYGSGGTSAVLVVQTSLDQGVNWIDVCRFDFAQADRKAHATVGVFAASAVTALAALVAEGKLDNVLGDRLRAKLTTTGTYAGNTHLAVRAEVR